MNVSDICNGAFEAVGGGMIWLNVRQLLKDKVIKGVHWGPTVFFTSWGLFNLYFYPANNLWFSFAGGVSIVLANLTWLYLVWKFYNGRNAAR